MQKEKFQNRVSLISIFEKSENLIYFVTTLIPLKCLQKPRQTILIWSDLPLTIFFKVI